LQTFEEKSRLVKILNECVAGDSSGLVQVLIGKENPVVSMQHCAVITTPYRVGTDVCGTLGVVGPTRIAYGRMMAVVNYLGRFMERAFSDDAALQ
jgi:heat-inducible transcriptional repressor